MSKKSKSQLATGSHIKEFPQVALSTTSVIIPQNSKSQKAFILIDLIPDLSAAAFRNILDDKGKVVRAKCPNRLALWYSLRAINTTGCGHIRITEALDKLSYYFKYTPKTAYRHLKEGEGLFWSRVVTKRGSEVKIYGLSTVCQYLTTTLQHDRHHRCVSSDYFDTPLKRRAEIYASIHKPKTIQSAPVSRESIEASTGLHKVQQRRYERVARVRRVPQYLTQEVDGKILPVRLEIFTKRKGHRSINKRLGNVYNTQQIAGSIGMLRKVSRQLSSIKSCDIPGEAPKVRLSKRYFKSMRAITKHFSKHKVREAYFKLRGDKRLIVGRQEWCLQGVEV